MMNTNFTISNGSRGLRALAMGAVALLAFACAKPAAETGTDSSSSQNQWEQLGGQKLLTFRTGSASQTKADGESATALPENTSFGVYAFYQEGDVDGGVTAHWTDGGWNPAFMFNQQVYYEATGQAGEYTINGGKYSYTPWRYWPANEENTISFWAYYPYGAGSRINAADDNEYTNASTGLPRVQFTADGTTDLMTSDLMEDYVYDTNDGIVPFTFHHRLANVKILAKKEFSGMEAGTDGYDPSTDGNALEGTVKITSIKVNGLAISGIYDPTADSWTVGTGTQTWSAVATGTTVTTDPTQVATYLHIPQTLSDDVTIEIAYTVTYNLPEGDEVTEFTKSFKLNSATATEGGTETAGITAWEQNKQYSYTLTISQIEVMLQLQVDPITEVYYDSDHEDYLIKL